MDDKIGPNSDVVAVKTESTLKLVGNDVDRVVEILDQIEFNPDGSLRMNPQQDETARWSIWIYAAIVRETNPMLAKTLDMIYGVMPTQCMRHIATELWKGAQDIDRKERK